MDNQPASMKILQWNAAGLYKSKLLMLKADLRLLNPALVILCETGWNDQYKAVFTAYNPFVINRQNQRGGGVAILVKKSIPASPIVIPHLDHIEAVGVTIRAGGREVDVVSAYCPHGDCDIGEIRQLFGAVGEHAIIAGDFNGHSPLWADGRRNNQCGHSLVRFLDEDDRFVLNTPKNLKTRVNPTNGTHSTIDLTFTTVDLGLAASIHLGPRTWRSDHNPIICSIDIAPDIPADSSCRW